MQIAATVFIDVTVHDMAALRAYALQRALGAGMSQSEFEEGFADHAADGDIPYLLGWAFDAGTPPNCGFTIEQSNVQQFDGE